MAAFSHSPSVNPERRAASLAASRTSGSMPLTLQGMPDFIIILYAAPPGLLAGLIKGANTLKVNVSGKNSVKQRSPLRNFPGVPTFSVAFFAL
jgi:hypothetical protein